MTRMFFHLCLAVLFVSLTSCSIFDSGDTMSASEIEGEADPIEIETAEGGEDEFEDLDIEEADSTSSFSEQASADSEISDDSFGDIEGFNEGQIENELSDESMTASTVELGDEPKATGGGLEELDLEVADMDADGFEPETAATVTATSSVSTSGNTITNLEYKSQQSGGSVVITAAEPFEYQVRDEPEFNQTVIEIADVELPNRFKLPYIAKDFEQAVATVNAYQEAGSSTARFVIQYKDKLTPAVQLAGSQLLIMNSGGVPTNVAAQSRMSGKKISLEMQDVRIKDLIYFIADEVGVNIIVDDSVSKSTSVKLKDTPWEEALSLILKTNGLAYERRGEILRVAEIKTITEEYNQEAARITAQEGAQRAAQARAVKVIPVNYANIEDLIKQVQPFLTKGSAGGAAAGGTASSDAGVAGNVVGDKRSSSIIINDYDAPMKRAEKLIRSLDVPPTQILIEGKIIEASEEFSREFGIQWNQAGGIVEMGAQTLTLDNAIKSDRPAPQGGFLGTLTYGTMDGLGDITSILSLYEREQKVKVLSSPKIVTLNKEKAQIELTNPVATFTTQLVVGAGAQQTPTFDNARIGLTVTPQVSFNSDIIMNLEVNRDVPGPQVSGGRGISRRKAITNVIVKDGQALVLGGILDQTENFIEGGIPLLKDIPVLGYLFKTKVKEVSKTELVIFLTPRILNPETMLKTTEISSAGDVVKSQFEADTAPRVRPEGDAPSESFDEIENEVESL